MGRVRVNQEGASFKKRFLVTAHHCGGWLCRKMAHKEGGSK